MKKLFIFSLLVVLGFSAVSSAKAQTAADIAETAVQAAEITVQDLGVEDPGMLPTSPFYFLKNWGRGVKRIFTFNPIKKAELELNIVNQRAAEIKKIQEIGTDRIEAISGAIDKYRANVERLKERLETISETSQNPNVDKLMEKLVERSIKHQELFDGLKQKFEGQEDLQERLVKAREKISEAIIKVPQKFDNPEIFRERLNRAMEKMPEHPFKELKAIEILDRFDHRLSEEQLEGIEKTKDDFIKKLEERMKGLKKIEKDEFFSLEILEKLPGDLLERIKILEEIGNRTKNIDLKSRFENIKDDILEKTEEAGLTMDKIDRAYLNAVELIKQLEEKIAAAAADNPGLKTAKEHLAKARIRLNEGKARIEAGDWQTAFGHIVSASVLSRNGLRQLLKPELRPISTSTPAGGRIIYEEDEEEVCVQIITPACNPLTGECRKFPTPCDVPAGWKKIEAKEEPINIERIEEKVRSFLNY